MCNMRLLLSFCRMSRDSTLEHHTSEGLGDTLPGNSLEQKGSSPLNPDGYVCWALVLLSRGETTLPLYLLLLMGGRVFWSPGDSQGPTWGRTGDWVRDRCPSISPQTSH